MRYVFKCPKCEDFLIQAEEKAPFCSECGSQRVLVNSYEDKSTVKQEPIQIVKPSIEALKKELAGSPISLRKQKPECNAQGHYCATSKNDGDICLSRASEKTIQESKTVGIDAKFEAKLCSKNPEKGKKKAIETHSPESKIESKEKTEEFIIYE